MMSLAKYAPKGLNPQECKQTKLCESPPVPYIPKKDKVQEEVAKLHQLQIKTLLEKDTTLNFPVWQENGTREAFLMHVMAVLDIMKKRGHFNDYDRAQKAYEEAAKAAELAEAGLALLEGTSEKTSKRKLKKITKAKEAAKEALAKVQETEPEPKEAEAAPAATDDLMKAGFQADLEKAMQAQETAQGAMTAAATLMFAFYSNLLSPESKYAWNKIVVKQTESNPNVNLQGVSLEGQRKMSRELLNDCVMFHLLTAFPINAAEQEKYYILNILKKPQRVNVHQFVRRVEQLNAYISQMPCFYYSLNANTSSKPENIPFMEAELGAHVLRMCPIQWQDRYNMNKKDMAPMGMHSLLISLEVIERVCTYKKGQIRIIQEVFSQEQEREETPWCVCVLASSYKGDYCNLRNTNR
jgi:hypothetical protein